MLCFNIFLHKLEKKRTISQDYESTLGRRRCKDPNFRFTHRSESNCILQPLHAHIHLGKIPTRANQSLNSLQNKNSKYFKKEVLFLVVDDYLKWISRNSKDFEVLNRITMIGYVVEWLIAKLHPIASQWRHHSSSHEVCAKLLCSHLLFSFCTFYVFSLFTIRHSEMWVVWEFSRTPSRSFRYPNRSRADFDKDLEPKVFRIDTKE